VSVRLVDGRVGRYLGMDTRAPARAPWGRSARARDQPNACSGWLKSADSRAANRVSQASQNSLPALRMRPSICAMVTRRPELRYRNRTAIDGTFRDSVIEVASTEEVKWPGSALVSTHLKGVVGFGPRNEGYQVADQFGPHAIHGRRAGHVSRATRCAAIGGLTTRRCRAAISDARLPTPLLWTPVERIVERRVEERSS
jgi:hypothetical protein